ncbi:SLC13 family permease [Cryptosporangium sp. NPDC051539]|uniref:SLC13 family permease n=1 Tax=Cryptosporangium sp. NPDC051539 TaxID=3363962 RepID=UPI0037AE6547
MVRESVRRRPRLEPLDWVGLGLFAAGLLALAFGLVPLRDAEGTMHRVVPLLVFLGTVIVLAELTAQAQVFDVVATWLARLGRGRFAVLFALCVVFATLVTAVLNLDTTAVLLTPVMVALATRLGVRALPFAMVTVWLANTASLLLPVSNLTNLLAADRVGLSPVGFAARMALPELASVLATAASLWLFYWRRGSSARYEVPEPHRPPDRRLTAVCAAACLLFVVLVLVGVPLDVAAPVCAVVVLVTFAVRDRSALRWSLVPWRLLVLVTGLFLVMDAIGRLGLSDLLRALLGDSPSSVRVAGVSAVMANLVNNLPAYVAVEAAVPRDALLGVLIGVNVGPIVVPWASVATLLWYERCRAAGVPIAWGRFVLTSAVTATVALVAAVAALAIT